MLSLLWPARRATAPRLATREDFVGFLASRAAFVSQKATVQYCYARAGVHWDKLMREAAFAEAMERCRWEAYAAVASGLGLMLEGLLRPHAAGAEPALGDAMRRVHAAALATYPPPPHDPGAWAREEALFHRLVGQKQMAAPLPAHAYGAPAGRRIHAALPIHARLRAHDTEMVVNSLRFAFVGVHDEAGRRLDAPALGAALAAAAPDRA